jgi:hypothetical protein
MDGTSGEKTQRCFGDIKDISNNKARKHRQTETYVPFYLQEVQEI